VKIVREVVASEKFYKLKVLGSCCGYFRSPVVLMPEPAPIYMLGQYRYKSNGVKIVPH
jgi:hypothetical protein